MANFYSAVFRHVNWVEYKLRQWRRRGGWSRQVKVTYTSSESEKQKVRVMKRKKI